MSAAPRLGPLARDVLALPPPPDLRSGEIGTTHLDAYQEYLAGVRALGRFDLDVAQRRFAKALSIDSTFALAHLGIERFALVEAPELPRREIEHGEHQHDDQNVRADHPGSKKGGEAAHRDSMQR